MSKPLLVGVLLVAACGDKSAAPAPTPIETAPSEVRRAVPVAKVMQSSWLATRVPADLAPGESLTISGVKVTPIPATAGAPLSFSVTFTPTVTNMKSFDKLQVRAMCRVGDARITAVDLQGPYGATGTPIDATISLQPYKEAPSTCQLDWFYSTTPTETPARLAATACYHRMAREIVPGPCAAEAAPKLTLPEGVTATLELQPGTMKLDEKAFSFSAVVSAGPTVLERQQWRIAMACEDAGSVREVTKEHELLPAHLELLPPGESMWISHTATFEKGRPASRCELQLLTGAHKSTLHARYCVIDGSTLALGACTPPLRK